MDLSFSEYLKLHEDVQIPTSEIGDGTYISAEFTKETNIALSKYTKSIGLKPINDFHVTLCYSVDTLNIEHNVQPIHGFAKPLSLDYLGEKGNDYRAIVLKLQSKVLNDRVKYYETEHNYKSKYPDFIAHVSLVYKPQEGLDLSKLPLPDFTLKLQSEIITDLKD